MTCGEESPEIWGITNSSRWRGVIPARSSLEDGEENTGECVRSLNSSTSDSRPLSKDAVKLDISGSETTAKDECDDVDEMVRPRAEARGSSCHAEVTVSTAAYKRPLTQP